MDPEVASSRFESRVEDSGFHRLGVRAFAVRLCCPLWGFWGLGFKVSCSSFHFVFHHTSITPI